MELKINYQYTYFIYPFVINESKYNKYMIKLLKDKNCKIKNFQKEKDLRLYKYFLPKVREFLFTSFSFTNSKMNRFEDLPIETRAAILSKYQCAIFEYDIGKNIQGKAGDFSGIFFNIHKMDIICFNTGICFLCIKTNVENSKSFDDVLNFNYKFRDINQDITKLKGLDNIHIQTNAFENASNFTEFIKSITGSNVEAMKLDLDTEKFLTYSYVCIDQEAWNKEEDFEKIEYNFTRYANVLPANSNRDYKKDKNVVLSNWKYAKLGLTKFGSMLFASSTDMNNYTILPDEYEREYFYTYLLSLYKKIYLKRLSLEFKNPQKVKSTRKKFIEFTRNLWIEEITDDETGTILNHKLKDILELDRLYYEVKNEYDVLYKESNIEKNTKATIVVALILTATLVVNIINFVTIHSMK